MILGVLNISKNTWPKMKACVSPMKRNIANGQWLTLLFSQFCVLHLMLVQLPKSAVCETQETPGARLHVSMLEQVPSQQSDYGGYG